MKYDPDLGGPPASDFVARLRAGSRPVESALAEISQACATLSAIASGEEDEGPTATQEAAVHRNEPGKAAPSAAPVAEPVEAVRPVPRPVIRPVSAPELLGMEGVPPQAEQLRTVQAPQAPRPNTRIRPHPEHARVHAPAAATHSDEPVLRQQAPSVQPATSHARAAPETGLKEEARDFTEPSARNTERIPPIIEGNKGPLGTVPRKNDGSGGRGTGDKGAGGNGGGGGSSQFHKRQPPINFQQSYGKAVGAVRKNLIAVMVFTLFVNILVLAVPVYLFQISDRVLTSQSTDTLIMLTIAIVGAVILQAVLDAIRRFVLMRTAVEVEVQLGAPILSAAARASLMSNGRDYQVLGDLQQLRSFITSGTLLQLLDAPLAPIFVVAVFLVHPHLGYIVIASSLCLFLIATINQRMTHKSFAEARDYLSRATQHLDSMSRNSQIINALAMIPEAVRIWGRDTAKSLRAQVAAQDLNIIFASFSKGTRLLTQITMLGWGANLALQGHLTGGMVIMSSIIASRALAPIEGAIEGWSSVVQFRTSLARIKQLLQSSPLNFERLLLPRPEGRLDVERVLFVPPPNKRVILNGISFSLLPGESLAVIGNSGAGKTTLGKMLVGSVLPTSGNVRLDLMDLRNWDPRQFGESIGYLPQDVQLFPGTIKANIARMREDASDEAIFEAAVLADVHELISSFPQGYETFVTADGAPLSGGQKQRIALARAFFGSPKLVVLDEPNSNLDAGGEAALAKAIIHAKKQKITVVTITQRPSLLNCVDKIMVLNNGTVSMLGTRTEVLKAMAAKKDTATPIGPSAEDTP